MEAKEKALYLIELFWCEVDDLDIKEVKMSKSQAIQCALICVDEIIDTVAFTSKQDYWQSIKQELLNIK